MEGFEMKSSGGRCEMLSEALGLLVLVNSCLGSAVMERASLQTWGTA